MRGRSSWVGALLGALAAVGCARDAPGNEDPAAEAGSAQAGEDAAGGAPGTTYRRSVVFMGAIGDSALLIPWQFENRVAPDGLVRAVRGWLGRGGEWAMFLDDEWTTGPSRAPWRVVTRGAARMMVGPGDVLREIRYRQDERDLSLRLGAAMADWNERLGVGYRLLHGTAQLGEMTVPGIVFDAVYVQAPGSEAEPGFAIELGALVVQGAGGGEAAAGEDPGADPLVIVFSGSSGMERSQVWVRRGESVELHWPDARLIWEETRSFARASRDIPVQWRIESGQGSFFGRIAAVSSHVRSLDAAGHTQVVGVYEVVGEAATSGRRLQVAGLLIHHQR